MPFARRGPDIPGKKLEGRLSGGPELRPDKSGPAQTRPALSARSPTDAQKKAKQGVVLTSDAEGITTGGRVHALTVSVWSGVHSSLDRSCSLPPYLSVRTFACAPHASQPAASGLARVGDRDCACARAACSPELGRGLCPVCADFPEPAVRARAFPACPTACSPSRLSLLSGAARPVSLAQSDGSRRPHSRPHRPPKLAPRPGFLQRRRRGRSLTSPCARLPSLGPWVSPQAPPTRSRSLAFSGFGQENVFF